MDSQQDFAGLRLREECITAATNHLRQAANQPPQAWIDCQLLYSRSWLGQRTILQVDGRTRADGTMPYWCGLPSALHAKLAASGLGASLHLLPTADFQWP